MTPELDPDPDLATLVRSEGLPLAGTIGLSVLASGAGIALMGTSAWLLSRAAEHPPVLYLMVAIVTVRACGLARGVFRYLERLVSHEVALRLQSEFRLLVYRRLARSAWLGAGRGDLLSRVVLDTEAVQTLVVRVLVPFASAGILTVAVSTALTVLSPPAGLLIFVSAVVAGIGLPWLAQWGSRRAEEAAAPLRGRLATAVDDAATGSADLLAYGATRSVQERIQAIDAELQTAEARSAWVGGLTSAGQVLAAGFAVVASLLVAGQAVSAGALPAVHLAVLVLTPVALHETLAALPGAAQAWRGARCGLARVRAVLSAPTVNLPQTDQRVRRATDRTRADRPAEGAFDGADQRLRLDTVSIGWPGHRVLARDLTLDVGLGERVAVVGPSGCGKTTLAATIIGLIPPVDGRVDRPGRIGYLAQDAHIFDTTVAENVRIGRPDATDAEVRAAADRAWLDLSLDRLVGEYGISLSGGETRRLALSRLLLDDYSVLVLDEPTEHLDRPTATALIDDLWSLTPHTALVVITHDPELIARCDRQISLSDGVPSGRPQDLDQM